MNEFTILDRWKILPVSGRMNSIDADRNLRLNSLASMFYFSVACLGMRKMTRNLHGPLCRELQQMHLKESYIIPRGHFKSSICSEALPMWRTLRVREEDAVFIENIRDESGRLAYNSDFLRYLTTIHNPNQAWLLCSETQPLARGLMRRIRLHYEEREAFRRIFHDMLPGKCVTVGKKGRVHGQWGANELTINRDDRTRSEATFTCKGAGQPLQSAHYDGGVIEDDVVGEKSLKSPLVMQTKIDWHKRMTGILFDDNPEFTGNRLIVGNRWNFSDLQSYVIKHEPWYNIHKMQALWCGRCKLRTKADLSTFHSFPKTGELNCICGTPCVPIFPEMFTLAKLHQIWKEESDYNFACQYLNDPAQSSDSVFRTPWLRTFEFVRDDTVGDTVPGEGNGFAIKIRNTNDYGDILTQAGRSPDVALRSLNKYIIVDPSHGSTSVNACRAAITVTGVDCDNHKYLLDVWAEVCNQDVFIEALNRTAEKWNIPIAYVEGNAGQATLGRWVNSHNSLTGRMLRVIPIVPKKGQPVLGDSSLGPPSNNKEARIQWLQPVFSCGEFSYPVDAPWAEKFLEEYTQFTIPWTPGTYVDILDALAYGPHLWRAAPSWEEVSGVAEHNQRMLMARNNVTGY